MRVLRVAGDSEEEACDHGWGKVEGTQRREHLQRKDFIVPMSFHSIAAMLVQPHQLSSDS